MPPPTLVRTIYLYLFALLGLVLVTIGGVNFLEMALKAYVFTEADSDQRYAYTMPPSPFPTEGYHRGLEAATPEERATLERWAVEYRQWEQQYKGVDQVKSYRQREAATSLAMILIGAPLYLFHWRLTRRESAERKRATDELPPVT